jgi:TolA-binding protein/HEAT repeat protein
MKHTLMRLMIVSAAMPLLAAAQVPPVSPAPRARPAPKVRPPAVAPQPMEPFLFDMPPMPPMDMFDMASLKMQLDQMRLHDMDFRDLELQLSHIDVDKLKLDAEQMMSQIDVEQLKRGAEDMMSHLDVAGLRFGAEQKRFRAEELAQRAMVDLPEKLSALGPMTIWKADKLLNIRPRTAWSSDDPADSLYRIAREALNRGEYRRAAQLFSEVTKKFPKSDYAPDCAYWRAFSLYRAGGTDDLKQALRILGESQVQLASVSRESNVDVPALRARIQGALAARGDRDAAVALQSEAKTNGGCDREDIGVRAEALSALGQMDRASAMPIVKKILARRDECTVELRRRALFVAARDADADAVNLIMDVAKNDSDQSIRSEAMRWLPRVAGDNAVPQLEELLRTSTDEQAQRSAIQALGSIDSDRARKAIRAIIERNDAPERVRYEAIYSISRERDGRPASADDVNYLRALYTKVDAPRLREAVLMSLSRIETPDNAQFLLGIARNVNEVTSLRASALQRLGRMQSVSANDIAKLYDVADARSLREQILHALSQRKEPEAIDKMMDIARKDTDPSIRRTAISLLARSNNDRAKKLLQELIDR